MRRNILVAPAAMAALAVAILAGTTGSPALTAATGPAIIHAHLLADTSGSTGTTGTTGTGTTGSTGTGTTGTTGTTGSYSSSTGTTGTTGTTGNPDPGRIDPVATVPWIAVVTRVIIVVGEILGGCLACQRRAD